MKNIKKLMLFVLAILASFMFYGNVNADDNYSVTDPDITISSPKAKSTFYVGEALKYRASITNSSNKYSVYPYAAIASEKGKIFNQKLFGLVSIGGKANINDSFKLTKITPGEYLFGVALIGVENENVSDYDKVAGNVIKIKKLKAPTKVKAKGKKKAIKISYKKATGATEYYIYRSKKAKKGYKLIAKTKKTSYTNKKLKKGKRYYYKVKSVRNVNGSISSSYSKKVSGITK